MFKPGRRFPAPPEPFAAVPLMLAVGDRFARQRRGPFILDVNIRREVEARMMTTFGLRVCVAAD